MLTDTRNGNATSEFPPAREYNCTGEQTEEPEELKPVRRYCIRVTEEAAKATPITFLDPPPSVWLTDRKSANELCRRLNTKLGYERFFVEEQ
jgi:hypothetical protein